MLHSIYLSNNNNNKKLKKTSAEASNIPFNTANVEGPKDNHSDRHNFQFINKRGTAAAARLWMSQAYCKSPVVKCS